MNKYCKKRYKLRVVKGAAGYFCYFGCEGTYKDTRKLIKHLITHESGDLKKWGLHKGKLEGIIE